MTNASKIINREMRKRESKGRAEEIAMMVGVRIDIWTHLMRECIMNYVH